MTRRGIWKRDLKIIGSKKLYDARDNLCTLYMKEAPTRPVVGFLRKYDHGFKVESELFEFRINHKDRICIFYPNGDNLEYEVWES